MAEFLNLILNDSQVEENAGVIKSLGDSYHAYAVVLKRPTKNTPFGFGYRCIQPDTGLVITVLCKHSLVAEWNKVCDVGDTVCVGDRIMAVNGEADAKVMVQELRKSTEVRIRLLKAGPRWHLDGATAECLRKLDWAVSKGLTFETKSLGDGSVSYKSLGTRTTARCSHYGAMLTGICMPVLFMLVAFSDVYFGIQVYGTLSPFYYNTAGNFLAFLSACYGAGLYVGDWTMWSNPFQKYIAAAMCFYSFCFAFILKCRFYPFGPLIICLIHIVVFLGLLRASVLRTLTRATFYKVAWRSCVMCAFGVLAIWLTYLFLPQWKGGSLYNAATKARLADDSKAIYDSVIITVNGKKRPLLHDWDCLEKFKHMDDYRLDHSIPVSNGYTLTNSELNERDTGCAQVKTIWFLMWISPLVSIATSAVIGAFCFLNTWEYTQDGTGIEKLIKGAIVVVCVILMTMWLSASVAAANMSLTSTLMAFCAASMIVLMIWCYLEIGRRAITSSIKESKLMQMLIILATSNWVRASLLVAFNILIPCGYVLAWLNQKVRKLRKVNTTDGRLTDGAEKVMRAIQYWNWGNILLKANYLVMVYWLFFVGVAKWTYVFLSWLNSVLIQVHLALVLAIFFVIGFTMFLLPPVPGVPVYITSGVVIAARASATSVGFYGGIGMATILSFTLKLVACSGQYAIGWLLGKSVKVQQMVGVDKILMRGVEKILLQRGLTPKKVAVLVGGPDWPTSVICGILNLNIAQILLGTVPVIFVSTPCVLAGAFLSGPSGDAEEEKGTYNTMASSLLAFSMFLQGASMLLAVYYIQDTVTKHTAELSRPRPEHQPVVELTRREAEANAAWNDVLKWDMLEKWDRVLILASNSLTLLSMFIFAFMDEACHRPFQVNNEINASFGKQGLEGNPLNIVLPMGWLANGLFFLGVMLHSIFIVIQKRKAAVHLEWKRQNPRSTATRKSGSRLSKSPQEDSDSPSPKPMSSPRSPRQSSSPRSPAVAPIPEL